MNRESCERWTPLASLSLFSDSPLSLIACRNCSTKVSPLFFFVTGKYSLSCPVYSATPPVSTGNIFPCCLLTAEGVRGKLMVLVSNRGRRCLRHPGPGTHLVGR